MDGAKLMPDEMLEVSNQYLSPFLSNRENPGGGRIYPPPPETGRWLKRKSLLQEIRQVCCHSLSVSAILDYFVGRRVPPTFLT